MLWNAGSSPDGRGDGSPHAAAGAGCAVVAVLFLHALAAAFFFSPGVDWPVAALAGLAVGVVSLWLFLRIGRLARWVLEGLGGDAVVALAAAAASLLLLREFALRVPSELFPWLLVLVFVAVPLFGIGATGLAKPYRYAPQLLAVGATGVGGAGVVVGLLWLFGDGGDPYPRAPMPPVASAATAAISDPAVPGDYRTTEIIYGASPGDLRPEFGPEADVRSRTVDLSAVLPQWDGFTASHREWYLGFGLDRAPLNGRMHLPDGPKGDRRPVALVVHGNHRMEDWSDGGYDYLTRVLASHGVAAVSVDANFLNGTWSGDFGGREMPARAILLLEHLRLLRDWNEDPDSPLEDRLDLDRVALIGHSRGGEAAAIAAVFNRQPAFPDNADFAFDYDFGIVSVVAVAQIDRRYTRRMELEGVNFFAIHGSYDTDEPSFHGLRQFHRTAVAADPPFEIEPEETRPGPPGQAPDSPILAEPVPVAEAPSDVDDDSDPASGGIPGLMKAALLFHRGNHGQFNSTWGMDSGFPGAWWLNREPLLAPHDQRRIAAAYVAAFLRVTLLNDAGPLPLLQDPRAGASFLPETIYLSSYADSWTFAIAGFEEDLDLTTASAPGSRIVAEGFSRWSEEELFFRDGSKQGSSAARLSWSRDGDGEPVYEVMLDRPVEIGAGDALVFSVVWMPDVAAPDRGEPRRYPELDLRVEAIAGGGPSRSVRISEEILSPEPPLEVRFLKSGRMNRARYRRVTEPIPQTVAVPAAMLFGDDGAPPREVSGVRFRFGREASGAAYLDDIGFRRVPRPGSPPPP